MPTSPYRQAPPTPEEARAAQQAREALSSPNGGPKVFVLRVGSATVSLHVNEEPGAAAVELPSGLGETLKLALEATASGLAVNVIPEEKELTTTQAAEILHVSRPYVVKLMEEGRLPFKLVGSHRRIHIDDLMAWKRADDERRRKILDELVAEAQELGLGYQVR